MSSTPARNVIELDGVGKRYWKLDDTPTLLASLLPWGGTKRSQLWAVRDLDVTIGAGETVGVLGRNGAGKTTLLRMLAGVSSPTEGRLTVVGRIAPLISVGVGFNRELSGRDNVFVNGLLLGLTAEQVSERFEDIVAFAEMGEFIDTPVKFYSSGMFMRLGFAVAAHTDPDVLLVDEVLAVGDSAFQVKCHERMRALQGAGTTIVMVTHSMHAVRLLCERAILIRRGRLEFDGGVEQAISLHHRLLTEQALAPADEGGDGVADDQATVTILEREIIGADGPSSYADPDVPVELVVRVRFDRALKDPVFAVTVSADDGRVAYGWHSPMGLDYRSFAAGDETTARIRLTPSLVGGSYQITTAIAKRDGKTLLAADTAGPWLYVPPRPATWGLAEMSARLTVDGMDVIEGRLRPVDGGIS